MPTNVWMINNFLKGEWWLKKKELDGHKRPNKRKKLRQLASCHVKLLEDGFPRDGVEQFFDVHLQHHPIEMHI
jgi:hypothetical protein